MKRKKGINIQIISMMVMGILLFTGCTTKNESKIDLLNNEQQKEEAFNQILNNQEVLNDFMDEMMAQPTSMNWMMESGQFMNHMFNQENLDYMRQHNPEIDNHMMNHMMNRINSDTSASRKWNDMMHSNTMH
jgi:PBP1b-binding outer membrane lipoprotein LpoB